MLTEEERDDVGVALQDGIAAVWRGLEVELGAPLSVWRAGRQVWPEGGRVRPPGKLPAPDAAGRLCDSAGGRLYFPYGEAAGNLVAAPCAPGEEARVQGALERRREAMELFDGVLADAEAANEAHQRRMVGRLIRSSVKIQKLFGLYGIVLPLHRRCRILLGRCGGAPCTEAMVQALLRLPQDSLRGDWPRPILWDGRILLAVTERHTVPSLAARCARWQEAARQQFSAVLSWGIGELYEQRELHRSYLEANMAWCLGRKRDVPACVFAELGIERMLLARPVPDLRAYVRDALGTLLAAEGEEDGQAFRTLRTLLAHDFSLARTAKALFVHVNTVRYRYGKIEKLLGVSLSDCYVRSNLYAAVLIWEVLTSAGLMEEGCPPNRLMYMESGQP